MKLFLEDRGKEYSYDELLLAINDNGNYYPYYKTDNLFLFLTNMTKAIVNCMPLTLIDNDINISEISGICESEINNSHEIYNRRETLNFDSLIYLLKNSTSEITIFTSGTTGQPKKVVHTLKSLTRNVRYGERYKDSIWAFAYNPTHMASLQVFFQAFENMNTLVNVFNMQRKDVYQRIDKYQITHISATPTFYRLLLPFEKAFFSVRRITLGGEKSDSNLYKALYKIFPNSKITNVYASTEAGSLFAANNDCFQIPIDIKDKFKVIEDELLIHKSLLGKSETFCFTDDYYHSGDLIEWVDKTKGLFKFKSRKNELINVGGYKVNPSEVEEIIGSIEGVTQVLVYGKDNYVLGNILCADVVKEKDVDISEMDIKHYLRNKLQDFKIPRRIKFVEELSLTRTGKLKRL